MDRAARAPDPRADHYAPLTAEDRTRLNRWGRCYQLQHNFGLTRQEAARLAFLALLVEGGCYAADRAPAAEE